MFGTFRSVPVTDAEAYEMLRYKYEYAIKQDAIDRVRVFAQNLALAEAQPKYPWPMSTLKTIFGAL